MRPLRNIWRMDAILAYDEAGNSVEPEWPEVDVIIGNPPFLGSKMLRAELGDHYIDVLHEVYKGRIPREADLVCYWFEQAREKIAEGRVKRAGLLATNSIRGGANRRVLEHIKETGDIFMAWSNRPWVLDGAAVRVSMIGFDQGIETERVLDGQSVIRINPDLTGTADLTEAERLPENLNLAFMGDTKQGPFDIDWEVARKMLELSNNPNGRPNSDVVRLWFNGLDITRRPRNMWIIDFGTDMPREEAEKYLEPFEYVRKHVKPERERKRRSWYRDEWWLHYAPRPALRQAIAHLNRYIATARLAKHRLFVWLTPEILPDSQLIAFARDDDYFFGVLHSKPHELWSLRQGSSLEDRPRYTPTSTFETYPFPWPPGQEPVEAENERIYAIAEAARQLVAFRQAWLNPPEEDIGKIISQRIVNKLTLTNLYNALSLYRDEYKGRIRDRVKWNKAVDGIITLEQIEELDYIHTTLDTAVLDAYGWPHTLTDEQILERLLALNLERARED